MKEELLLPYQREPAKHLRQVLATHRVGADLSDTGLGKTYIACAVAESLRPSALLVICPAAVRPPWRRIAESFGIQAVFAETYNKLRNGSTPWFSKHPGPPPGTRFKQKHHYRFTGSNDSLVIFDEAHNCAGRGTQNSELLVACKRRGVRTLILSATLAENPLQMRATGYALGLHSLTDYWSWAQKQHVVLTANMGPQWLAGKEMRDAIMAKVREQFLPSRGIRLRRSDLAHLFPENIVSAEVYEMDSAKIAALYKQMRKEADRVQAAKAADRAREEERKKQFDDELASWKQLSPELQAKTPEPVWRSAAAALQNARELQEIELLKVPTFLELAEESVAEGNRVALFVNFTATIQAIRDRADGIAVVEGGQKEDEREEEIRRFNAGEVSLIVLNESAGGTGISLHDTVGDAPRVALISPTYSAKKLQQVLGRCPRAGGKTPVVQKIIYAAGTPEEEACAAVRGKLSCLAALNDGDLCAGLPL